MTYKNYSSCSQSSNSFLLSVQILNPSVMNNLTVEKDPTVLQFKPLEVRKINDSTYQNESGQVVLLNVDINFLLKYRPMTVLSIFLRINVLFGTLKLGQ